jgi:Cof subfamily protein (haloacid dehalogenase superfamily)
MDSKEKMMSQAATAGSCTGRRTKKTPKSGQIKMISLDLDGTLLRSDNTIGPRTCKALTQAHRQGVKVVLNSGRMTVSMEAAADALGFDVYMIAYNGATASDLRSNGRKLLFEKPMPLDVARELVALAKQRGLQVNYYLDDLVYCEAHPQLMHWIELYRQRTSSPFRIVPNLDDHLHRPPYKVLFVTEPQVRDQLESELRPIYQSRATVTRTNPEYLEFLDPGVNKGVGLMGLAAALGLEMSQVMAVGDADNDAPMVEMAGWGVGVANAGSAVRAVADVLTEADFENDAVAEAVERWVL